MVETTPDSLLALLGLTADDPRVEAALRRFAIRKRPEVVVDEEAAEGSVVQVYDWVNNRRAGIEFGFEDRGSFQGLEPTEFGKGPMLLTQLYFYGQRELVRPYAGPMPFGIRVEDDRRTVRERLRAFEKSRRSYVRDTWDLPEFMMTVEYVRDSGPIALVLCILRPPPLPRVDEGATRLPSLDDIRTLFGKPWHDLDVRRLLVPLGEDQGFADIRQGHAADFSATHGFELGFQKPTPGRGGAASSSLVVAYAVFYRDRELRARQWLGELPFGLSFDDSLETVLRKVGSPPDGQQDQDLGGHVRWHLPEYTLHVAYSSLKNYLLQVRMMAPGVWEAAHAFEEDEEESEDDTGEDDDSDDDEDENRDEDADDTRDPDEAD